MSKNMIVAIGLLLLVATAAEAYGDRDEGRRRPPQVALDACSGADPEASCNFEGRRGDTLNGTCRAIEEELACVPDDHRRRQRGERGDDLGQSPEGE
jgi:hypothetical protein